MQIRETYNKGTLLGWYLKIITQSGKSGEIFLNYICQTLNSIKHGNIEERRKSS
jgi:hypothetical protein